MRISVLGSGNIGGTLGRKWAAREHRVVFGVRDPEATKVRALVSACSAMASAALPAASIDGADVVLIAIPGSATAALAAAVGSGLEGKIVIDATNNISQPVQNSLETLSQHAPSATLYRAFNNLGWENFDEPEIDGTQIDLFYCGQEGPTRSTVASLIEDVGLRPVYVGGIDQAPVVDNLTRLWFALALQRGFGRHLAFKMLRP